jgi:predicted metalloprotease with PDZ domain
MRRLSGAAIAVCALAWSAGATAAPTAPLLELRLAPGPMDEAINQGDVKVTIIVPAVDAPAGVPLFKGQVSDLTVSDSQGVVARAQGDAKDWVPTRPVKGAVTVRFDVAVSNTPKNGGTTPIFPRIDDKGFSALGMTFLPTLEITTPYRIRVEWDLTAMGPGATAVSSAGDGEAEMPSGPASRLQRMVFMAGRLHREPETGETDKFSAAWSGDPGFDLHPPMQWAAKLHAYMMGFFQTPDDPAYRVLIRRNGANNPGGGVAFPNAFFATYGSGVTAEKMKQILGHEMTHTFTANDLDKWYVEGDAVYYQVLLPWRAGMASTEAYLRDINLTAARYYTNAEIDAPESRIAPNFFKDPWMNTLAYDRGALYFAALDGKIKRKTGGKRSIDDLVRVMVRLERTNQPITDQTWIDLLRKEIGEDAVTLHNSMIAGGIVRPESGDFGPCFRRVDAKVRRYDLGFKTPASADGRKTVSELEDGSEAAKAGVRNGDVVELPVITTEGVKRDPQATVTLSVTRDGKTFPITYLPRTPASFDAYQWERVAGVPESACKALR